MTLLKFLRQQNNFTSNEVSQLLKDCILPDRFTNNARTVERFTRALRSFDDQNIIDLANDIESQYEIRDCYDCQHIDFADDQVSCYEGDYHICQSCCDDNYSYSEYRSTYVQYEDYDDEEEDCGQDYNGVYDYCHRVEDDLGFQRLPHEKHSKDTLYYGIELEVERRKNCPTDIAYHIQDNVLSGFAQCKSDGSLENGFEITTCPMTYGKHKEEWEKFFKDKQCMD